MVGIERLRRSMTVGRGRRLLQFFVAHHPCDRPLRRFQTDRRVVALTYDDGPNPPHTLDLLDVLERHGVEATFFMIGCNVAAHPEVAKAVLARGHEIGNHSYSHPAMILRTPAFVRREIEATDAILRGIGVAGQIRFRSPYGAHLFAVPYVVARTGRSNILFDVIVDDWADQDPAVIAERVLARCVPGSIVVLHDGGGVRAGTVAATPRVIEALRDRGYEVTSVRKVLASNGDS
jgi:peptidoglycan/xylan/chitin deacetylase (PgdA/CDA1 family)